MSGFDCGAPALNAWVVRFASSDQAAGASVTYVAARGRTVAGLYRLTPHLIEPRESSGRIGEGLSKGRSIGVFLLARLAVDRREQGTGLGAGLLRDALLRCAGAADQVGGRAVVVHAKDEAADGFYRRFGFVPLAENPQHLCVLMKDLRASVLASGG